MRTLIILGLVGLLWYNWESASPWMHDALDVLDKKIAASKILLGQAQDVTKEHLDRLK